jgi:hypothetical protein
MPILNNFIYHHIAHVHFLVAEFAGGRLIEQPQRIEISGNVLISWEPRGLREALEQTVAILNHKICYLTEHITELFEFFKSENTAAYLWAFLSAEIGMF